MPRTRSSGYRDVLDTWSHEGETMAARIDAIIAASLTGGAHRPGTHQKPERQRSEEDPPVRDGEASRGREQ